MYTHIKVATLVMSSELVLLGLPGWLLWRHDTLALYDYGGGDCTLLRLISAVASCRGHGCRKRQPTAGSMREAHCLP